jgi:hypothetical protein
VRMTCCGGADLILWFRLERGGDIIKHYRKIKRRHRAHLDSIGRKRDTVRQVTTSAGGEVAPGRGKGEDDVS